METENHIRNWSGPFGGVPQFDKIQKADFTKAVEETIAKGKAGIR
jgi:Zn-dependent oligopeptidase